MQPTLTNHLELRTNRRGEQRLFIAGTRVRVADIVSDYERHEMSAEEIVREFPHLTLAQVHAALAYYFDHREEMRPLMNADRQFAESMRPADETVPAVDNQ